MSVRCITDTTLFEEAAEFLFICNAKSEQCQIMFLYSKHWIYDYPFQIHLFLNFFSSYLYASHIMAFLLRHKREIEWKQYNCLINGVWTVKNILLNSINYSRTYNVAVAWSWISHIQMVSLHGLGAKNTFKKKLNILFMSFLSLKLDPNVI